MATIDDILNMYGLAHQLESSTLLEINNWFVPLEVDAKKLCENCLASDKALFCFVEDPEMQAVATQLPTNFVAMYAGMFWMLCRLSAQIVSKGVMLNMGSMPEPEWAPEAKRSLASARELLGETPFDWSIESAEWAGDGERVMLFYMLLSTMFRYVVLHELGHIASDHIRRHLAVDPNATMIVDTVKPLDPITPDEAIPSQACEVIADTYALTMLIDVVNFELEEKKDLEMTKIVREKLCPGEYGTVRFVLLSIYLFFRILDRDDWAGINLDTVSHPPSPFRLKAVLASFCEQSPLGMTEDEVSSIIRETIAAGDAIMSVTLNCYPNPDWLNRINSEEYDTHFARLYEEFPKWSGKMT